MIGGVLLHLPMLAHAHAMDMPLAGMAMDWAMTAGMAAIAVGATLACYGAIRTTSGSPVVGAPPAFEAPRSLRLNRWHAGLLGILILGLIIDVMKPATLGFVLPGLARDYALPRSSAAWLPMLALIGTVVGSYLWGWLADRYGRRTSIIISTILFVSTSICGAMPTFGWNLVMCFLMGMSAGGMLPVVYTLLTEILPSRHRGWLLVFVGGTGMVGGYLAASVTAHLLEPIFGWRVLWLQGFPTGILLLALARYIPESPRHLFALGRNKELATLQERYGIVALPTTPTSEQPFSPCHATGRGNLAEPPKARLTIALAMTALAWSFINFGLLLWLPTNLQDNGYSSNAASALISQSALFGFPAVILAAWSYSRWSSKWTLVAALSLTLSGLSCLLLPPAVMAWPPMAIAVIATLVVGTNVTIAVLLPYSAENYPVRVRGRATGFIAGSSKLGGVAVQAFALLGLLPTLGQAAVALAIPTAISAALIAWTGRETKGSSLGMLDDA